MSPLGFGAYQIGRVAGQKYASVGTPMPNEAEAELLLHGILDLGITLIDTAPAYGLSEERIGKYIRNRRDEYNLVTKVGELTVDGTCTFDFSSQGMRKSIEQSLRALQTEYVDCILLHAPPIDLAVLHETDAVETLQQFQQEGKTKTIGFSGKTVQAQEEAIAWSDVMMIEYSIANQTNTEIIASAFASDITVLYKKVLNSGHLESREALEFIAKKKPSDAVSVKHCAVIGSSKLGRMTQNTQLFSELE